MRDSARQHGPTTRGHRLDTRFGEDELRRVKKVAKWPTRTEQLSILSGQISAIGGRLSGQIVAAGGVLAGQIASRVEDLEKAAGAEAEAG